MKRIVQCVPNFSEGRNKDVVDAIAAEMKVEGANLIDVNMDSSYNRCVLTLVGEPEAVAEALFRACAKATELIDMNHQSGAHPRIGASDVFPFIPLRNLTIEDCIPIANQLGQRIATELKIPVYMYESAAKIPARAKLGDVRRGDYEGLREEMHLPERKPDYGDAVLHPTAGAIAIGVRGPLVPFNINLNTADVSIAKKIAQTFREAKGGYRDARAIGMKVEGKDICQVSTMINYQYAPLHRILEMVRSEAARYGVTVLGSEIIGLVPRDALMQAADFYLQLEGFEQKQILEEYL